LSLSLLLSQSPQQSSAYLRPFAAPARTLLPSRTNHDQRIVPGTLSQQEVLAAEKPVGGKGGVVGGELGAVE
jgi:hypothetical protein